MQQLSMTDAFMLVAENERQTLQMGSLSILAPAAEGKAQLTRQVLRDLVAERIHLAPALAGSWSVSRSGSITPTGRRIAIWTSTTTCATWR
jgi:hypothetical protein